MSIRRKTLASVGIIVMVLVAVMTTTTYFPLGTEAVVLVDDEAAQVEIGPQMLSSLGYRVTGFTDSLQALEYITANADKVQLVVTDMTMPQLTGASLAAKLLTVMPQLPIILCTGYSENITPEKAFALGIRDYVNKPVLLVDLARKIREILDGPFKK
jgi:two-component system, cell cycle sensor histidine kinase and response regulator CckA